MASLAKGDCPIHGEQYPLCASVTICRVTPDLATWSVAWSCPVVGCLRVSLYREMPAYILDTFHQAGARFYDLPARPAEMDDPVRRQSTVLDLSGLTWLDTPGVDIVAAARYLRGPK